MSEMPARSAALSQQNPTQPLKRLPLQPRNVHLRDAEVPRDLRLAHFIEEPQLDDALLARFETFQRVPQRLPLLDARDLRIEIADGVPRGGALLPSFVRDLRIE